MLLNRPCVHLTGLRKFHLPATRRLGVSINSPLTIISAFLLSITAAVDRLTCRAPAYLEFLHPFLVPPPSQSNSHLSKNVALSTTPQPQNSWANTDFPRQTMFWMLFSVNDSELRDIVTTLLGMVRAPITAMNANPKQQNYDIEASNLVSDCAWTANTDEVLQRHVASAGHWGRPAMDGEAGVNERR
ncbi:hypothetical protein F4604DRAFT_1912112 [Suillus subluteus]|nr:hypothetical protein F4604DRAFT_1912112 [Suillus subluteus]